MIPVTPQPEPPDFDAKVRQKGLRWLSRNHTALNAQLKSGNNIKEYWRCCLDDLHRSYGGVCAYLCIFIERTTGGVSVDHYVPKSRRVDLAYEWSNYRLACSTINSRKGDFEDVLDPFNISPETFHLELVTGRIYPTPSLSAPEMKNAQYTIDRLKLDDSGNRELRARWYQKYCEDCISECYLRRHSPFVWFEAHRQKLL